jgi:hypothetical protein
MEQATGDDSVPRPTRSTFLSGKPPVAPTTLAARTNTKRRTGIANNMRSMFKTPNAGKSSSDDASHSGSLNDLYFDDDDDDDKPKQRNSDTPLFYEGSLNDLYFDDNDDKPKQRNSDTALFYEGQAEGVITEPQDKPARRMSGSSAIANIFRSKKKPAEAEISADGDRPKRRNSDTAAINKARAKGSMTEPQDRPARRMSGSVIGKLFKSKKKPAEAQDRPERRASESALSQTVTTKSESSDTEEKFNEKIPKNRGFGISVSLRGERKLGKETDDGLAEKRSKRRGSGISVSLRGERKLGNATDHGSTEKRSMNRVPESSSSLRGERKLGNENDDDSTGKRSKSKGPGSSSSLRGERKLGNESDHGSTEKRSKSRVPGSSASLRGERKLDNETDDCSTEKSPKSRGSGSSVSLRGERKLGKDTSDGSTVASEKSKKKTPDTDVKPKRRGSAGAVTNKGSKESRSERGTDDSSTVGAPKPERDAGIGKDGAVRSNEPKKKSTVASVSYKSNKDGNNTTTTKKKLSKNSDKSKSLSDSVSSKDAMKDELKVTTSGASASSRDSKSDNSDYSPKAPGALSSNAPGKKKVKSRRAERKIDEENEKRTRGNSLGAVDKDKFRKKKKKKQETQRSFGENDAPKGHSLSMPDLMSIDGTISINDATSTVEGTLGNSLATLSLNDADPSSTTQQRAFAGDVPIAAENDGFASVSSTINPSSLRSNFAKEDPADVVPKPDLTKRPPLRRRSSLSAMDLTRPDLMQKPVRRSSFAEETESNEVEVLESKLRKENKQKRGLKTTKKDTRKQIAFAEDETGHRWNTQTAVRSDAEPVRQLGRALSIKEKEVLKRDLLFNKLEVVRLRQSLSDALDKAIKYSESQRQERKEFAKATTELMQLKMEHQKTVEERKRLRTDLDIYKDSLDEKDEKIDALTGAVDNQMNKVELLEKELEHAEDDLFKMEDQIREFEEDFPGIEGEPAQSRKSMKNIADDMDRELEEKSRHRHHEERQEILNLKEQQLEAKERMIELKLIAEKDGGRSQGEVGDRALLKELSDENKKLIEELVEEKEKASAQLRMKDGAQDTLLSEIDIMKDKYQVMQTQVDSKAEEHNLVIQASNQKLQGLIDENRMLKEKLERQKGHSESEDDVEEQLKEKDTEIFDLATDIEDLQEELAKLKKEKKKGAMEGGSDLMKKIASLKKSNVSLKEQLEAEQDNLTNSLHDESDVIAMLKTKVSRLQLDLESSKSINSKILESESRLKDKLASSQTLRDSESDRMQEAIDRLLVEKKTLEEEMKDGRTRTAMSLKTRDGTIAELQAQIAGLKGAVNNNSSSVSIELELQRSRFESLQVELDEAKARNTLLKGDMEELQAAKHELESKTLTLTGDQKSDLEALTAEVDEWKSKTSSLQEKMKDAASQVADWKRRAQEWEKEAAEWESVATGAQPGTTGAPPQSMYLSAASTHKKKEESAGWGLSNMFSRHSDHPRNISNPKLDEDNERVEMLETQNSALKETLTKLQSQLAEKNGA